MTKIVYPYSPSGVYPPFARRKSKGFTLIELAMVLVIIGLIVGGVLVGRDLIKAAEVRSQISQLIQYNTAVRTFQLKYNGLPGDLTQSEITSLGFTAAPTRVDAFGNSGVRGVGNKDGQITPYGYAHQVSYTPACCISGETAWFWEDLSTNSGMISGNFNYAENFVYPYQINESTVIKIEDIIPRSKFNGVYVNVYNKYGNNYFSLLSFGAGANIGLDGNGALRNNKTMLTPRQSYSMDAKIDDGLPQSGVFTAQYQQWDIAGEGSLGVMGTVWAAGGEVMGANSGAPNYGPTTAATPASATTCYDNGNVAGAVQQYSVGYNDGAGQNCAISYKMQ
jgi:prepilin-type N-terminal cleavage/methylation domain-containing protein